MRLAIKNLTRRPVRTAALLVLSVFLCFAVVGGSLVITGLRSGLSSLEARLGADIMVVPYEATSKSSISSIVLQGNPGYFYMSRSIADKIESREGIGQCSEQFYLATASTGCCSLSVQIIGFDPETDFTIMPWVQTSYKGELGYLEILVGHELNAFAGDTLTFYGTDVKVAARLEETGTYLDTSVYCTEETIKTLIAAAKEKQMYDFGSIDPDDVVSCVLINVAEGASVEDVLNDINIHVRKVEAIQTKSLISGVSDGLTGVSDVVGALIAVIWVLALLIQAFAFVMISNERKKEFAVLRAVGASRGQLARLLWKESLAVSLIGSLIGALLGLLMVSAFGTAIEEMLDLPFLLPGAGGTALLMVCGAAVSAAAGSLAAAFSAYRVSHIDTAVILRGEN